VNLLIPRCKVKANYCGLRKADQRLYTKVNSSLMYFMVLVNLCGLMVTFMKVSLKMAIIMVKVSSSGLTLSTSTRDYLKKARCMVLVCSKIPMESLKANINKDSSKVKLWPLSSMVINTLVNS
jgi:FtsH-binding integral membrane protein